MIEDTVNDMMDAVVAWLYDVLLYLARVLLYMLPPDFTSLSVTAMHEGIFFGNGFKVLVFACYAIVVVVGGFLVMSHETLQTRYSVREIVPRLVVGLLLVGVVWVIVPKAVEVNNDIVAAFVAVDIKVVDGVCTDPGYDYAQDGLEGCDWEEDVAISQFAYWTLYTPASGQEIGLFHILMILISIACLLVLLVTWVLRFVVLFMVVGLAPVGLACHGLPVTEQFAHLWWRMLGACMASSIGQAGLIWMWHDLRELFLDHEDDLLGYSFITGHIYLLVLVWMMWKVHAEAFRIARGRPTKVPGSRLLAAFVMSKVAGRDGRKPKRKFSTPGTIWGTDMTRPPWRRKDPDETKESAKQTTTGGKTGGGKGGGQGGGAPSGQGGPDKGPNGGGSSGRSGEAAAPARPASPHDQRAGAEPVTAPGGEAAASEPAGDRGVPSWKRPHPAVAEGGFDPDVAAVSLHGHPSGGGAAPAKPGSKSVPGKPKPKPSPASVPGKPKPPPGGLGGTAAAGPAPSPAGPGQGAAPPPRPSGRPREEGAPPPVPPKSATAPLRRSEAADPAPSGAPGSAGAGKRPGPAPRPSTPKPKPKPKPPDSKKQGE